MWDFLTLLIGIVAAGRETARKDINVTNVAAKTSNVHIRARSLGRSRSLKTALLGIVSNVLVKTDIQEVTDDASWQVLGRRYRYQTSDQSKYT